MNTHGLMAERSESNMTLYRSVGLQELELIYDSGMKTFPARLPQQPIFYPVLELEYARQIALDWNVKSGQFAGYVTQFKVDDPYIGQFEQHTVGGSGHQEYWIPADQLDEFNRHIIGHIKVVEAHFADEFQGFTPEQFGLQGKNVVEQFTLLANSYIYKRMEFYLELKRNHKAIFLNYPFWQKYDFRNQGLKEKVLQAIKEAWLTSFPKNPLPLPVPEDSTLIKQTDAHAHSLTEDVPEDNTPTIQADSHSLVKPNEEQVTHKKQTNSHLSVNPDHEHNAPIKQSNSRFVANHVHEHTALAERASSHFSQGLELGLSGKYLEAIEQLSKAVGEKPDDVLAHTSLGVAFLRSGEDERALSCFEAALKIDPIYAQAHYFRANILYSHGNVRDAIAGYTIAIGLEPELIEAHQKPVPQDRLTDYTGSPAEMHWIAKPAHRIIDLNKTLETNPGQAALFKERAAEYYRLRNYVQAIADYGSYLEIQPEDAKVLHLQGLAYEQLGQIERAQQNYRRAMEIDPQLSDTYIDRGVAFGKLGQFRQSIDSLTEALRLAPGNPDGYFNRGMTYFQQGDIERAIDDFSNVIQLSPGDEAAYYWRGISNEQAGRQRDAIADYRQFLAISQDPPARDEIERKLSQWNEGSRNGVGERSVVSTDGQETNQIASQEPDQVLDLYGLIVSLGERTQNSTWFGSGVDSYGEKAKELHALTDQNKPIEGSHLLQIASGIHQTLKGDFQAFDPGATSPWIFIRAWDGSGFYIETNDPKIKERLKTHFQSIEEVDGVSPPYVGLFLRI